MAHPAIPPPLYVYKHTPTCCINVSMHLYVNVKLMCMLYICKGFCIRVHVGYCKCVLPYEGQGGYQSRYFIHVKVSIIKDDFKNLKHLKNMRGNKHTYMYVITTYTHSHNFSHFIKHKASLISNPRPI